MVVSRDLSTQSGPQWSFSQTWIDDGENGDGPDFAEDFKVA